MSMTSFQCRLDRTIVTDMCLVALLQSLPQVNILSTCMCSGIKLATMFKLPCVLPINPACHNSPKRQGFLKHNGHCHGEALDIKHCYPPRYLPVPSLGINLTHEILQLCSFL